MKEEWTFDEAFERLQQIMKEIDGPLMPMETLKSKVIEARRWIEYCEKSLRSAEGSLLLKDGDENEN